MIKLLLPVEIMLLLSVMINHDHVVFVGRNILSLAAISHDQVVFVNSKQVVVISRN